MFGYSIKAGALCFIQSERYVGVVRHEAMADGGPIAGATLSSGNGYCSGLASAGCGMCRLLSWLGARLVVWRCTVNGRLCVRKLHIGACGHLLCAVHATGSWHGRSTWKICANCVFLYHEDYKRQQMPCPDALVIWIEPFAFGHVHFLWQDKRGGRHDNRFHPDERSA